jgi:hypothetical protein
MLWTSTYCLNPMENVDSFVFQRQSTQMGSSCPFSLTVCGKLFQCLSIFTAFSVLFRPVSYVHYHMASSETWIVVYVLVEFPVFAMLSRIRATHVQLGVSPRSHKKL